MFERTLGIDNRFYDERPKVKKAEENWPKSKKTELNVWPKIIRLNLTFSRNQKGHIGVQKDRNSGPSLAPRSLWPTFSVYLLHNKLWILWILTMICKIFCLESAFCVIWPFFFIFGLTLHSAFLFLANKFFIFNFRPYLFELTLWGVSCFVRFWSQFTHFFIIKFWSSDSKW